MPDSAKLPDDTVALEIDGVSYDAWTDVRIVRGIELMPSHFALRLTEAYPGDPKLLSIAPGQRCRLKIGGDLVLTGYIDRYDARVSTRGHEVTVLGRSATQDLVDCAAGVTAGQELQAHMTFSSPTLLGLAQTLCSPFGISVSEPDGEGTPLVSIADGIAQFTMPLGTTVYDQLEPLARIRQMLLLDGVDGNLVIAKVGTKRAGSGFSLPGSVTEAQVAFDKQDRYTIYLPAAHAFDQAMELSVGSGGSANYYAPVTDDAFKGQPRWDGQPRYRPRFVISGQIVNSLALAELLAKWEKARRFGRSQAVSAVVPLWRDAKGGLWQPNTLAPVEMPVLKLRGLTWLVTQVSYMKGFGAGTQAMVTLMPPEGFQPEPTFYQPFDPQITGAESPPPSPPATDGRRDRNSYG